MGWRFRKSVKILPGVRLNIGKRGITSASVGPKGLTSNISDKGVRNTIGIPGTGLSYTSSSWKEQAKQPVVALILAGMGVIATVVLCGVGSAFLTPMLTSEPKSAVPSAKPLYGTPLPTLTPQTPAPHRTPLPAATIPPTPTPKARPVYVPPTPVYEAPVSSSPYIRGPRGGCYYINSSGKKTYVDRGLCN